MFMPQNRILILYTDVKVIVLTYKATFPTGKFYTRVMINTSLIELKRNELLTYLDYHHIYIEVQN